MPTSTTQSTMTGSAKRSKAMTSANGAEKQPIDDFVEYWKEYAKEKPEIAAMWCFGLGFVIGWKLKPW